MTTLQDTKGRARKSRSGKTGAKIKPSSYDDLYKAVVKYIETRGGKIAVIGGVRIEQWPDDLKNNFWLSVKCTGIQPSLKP